MAITISGNAQMVGSLFSSMSSGSNSLFASTDFLGINYTDYSSIRSGSYYKLLHAYYSMDDTSESKGTNKKNITDQKKEDWLAANAKTKAASTDSVSKLADIESKAEKLKDTADTLVTVGTKSLFKTTNQTDEDGVTTAVYDTDKIYQAVKSFADQYNAMIHEASDSKVKRINTAVTSMMNYTDQNAKLLSSVGISIDEDTRELKVDEKAFKKADMKTAKTLFNGTGSYAYQVAVKASLVDYYAQNEASKANTYTSSGKYSYNYSSGSLWNSMA